MRPREHRWKGLEPDAGWTHWNRCTGECHEYSQVIVEHRDIHTYDSDLHPDAPPRAEGEYPKECFNCRYGDPCDLAAFLAKEKEKTP